MNDNIVKFPEMEKIDDDKVISTPAKDTGIKTISKLRKSVSEIDIEKIFKVTDVGRYYPYYSYDEDTNSYSLYKGDFKSVWDKKLDGWVSKIILKQPSGYNGQYYSFPDAVKNLKTNKKDVEIKFVQFWGSGRMDELSKCKVFYDKNRGDILYIHYDVDVMKLDQWVSERNNNPEIKKLKLGTDVKTKFFKNWLRSNIDTSIPNNWKECHSLKEFKFIAVTKTYEELTSKGLTYEDAEGNLIKNDPNLSVSSREFNGVRKLVSERDANFVDLRTNEEIIRDENKEDSKV